eukprot:CAMPEP_0184648284 /NCGR_PEP_ID=MMETSP0308-20130426/5366_1 /TAXON_ID=38269 /ORGANISM="Gloeochaete witrockiana, Strain SAG 46.84" /LENGTH=233 /DNA_ID=CAMNT_0027079979 /DNA_START=1 /DNA_END=702 /DNA_ORIENTATION=+
MREASCTKVALFIFICMIQGAISAQQGIFQAPSGTMPQARVASHPAMPEQFYAVVQTTALYLDKDLEYPPPIRKTTVWYDRTNGRIRAEFEAKGQPWKALYRRYDKGMEFEIVHIEGRNRTCQFSKMREKMPLPEWPQNMTHIGQSTIRGRTCNHWQEDNGYYTVDFYESIGQVVAPVLIHHQGMDYDILDFKAGPIEEDIYQFPKDLRPLCTKVPNHVGFPYVHLLYTYLRF